MTEFLQLLSTPVNLGLSVLLGLCLLYWILILISGLDADFLDFDFDMDGEVDFDLDLDGETDGDAGNFFGVLHYFNFGALPMMFIFSVLFLCMWVIAMLSTNFLGTNTILSFLFLIPNFFVSLFLTKYMTLPIVKPFNELTRTAAPINYIGRKCIISLSVRNGKVGEAELIANDAALTIMVKGIDDQTYNKGETVIIVDKLEDKKIFLISKT